MTYEVEVSFAYGLTVPGAVPYSSENFRAALTITQEFDAESEDEAREAGLQSLATLADEAKLATIAQAGLSTSTDENGVIHPVFSGQVTEVAVTNVVPITALTEDDVAAYENEMAGPSAGLATPMWDGRPIRIFDNRNNKKSMASPDFRIQFLDAQPGDSDDDKFKPFWLKNKDGTLNKAALKIQAMVG